MGFRVLIISRSRKFQKFTVLTFLSRIYLKVVQVYSKNKFLNIKGVQKFRKKKSCKKNRVVSSIESHPVLARSFSNMKKN